MGSFITDWLRRLNSRETLLLLGAVALVLTGTVDTMQEAIAIAGTFGPFIVARQYTKSRDTSGLKPLV